MKLDDFLNLFRQTEVPAPLSGETVRQFGSFSAAEGNPQERTALSNRARQVQATQAFLAEHNNYLSGEFTHMRGFFRHNPKDESYDRMYGAGLRSPSQAGATVGIILNGLGAPPKPEELLQMTDEQLVENYPRILQFAQIADSARQLLDDRRFRESHQRLQQAQSQYISREIQRTMTANAAQRYGVSAVSGAPMFYTLAGELVKEADGTPATANSAEVFSVLLSGGSLIGMQGGKATQFSLSDGGNIHTLKSEEPAITAAENQLKNITSNDISAMLQGIKAGDSAMLIFTGSRQYKALKTQAETFPVADGGMKSPVSMRHATSMRLPNLPQRRWRRQIARPMK